MGRTRTTAAIVTAGALVLAGCSSTAMPAGSPAHDQVAAAVSASPSAEPAAATGQVRLLDPGDFEAQSMGRVLINVHIPDEGSLPGTALDLPYDQVQARAADLPADRATPLAIYCMSGNMSAIAGRELVALGYTDVIELDGGMRAWQASGRTLLPAG
jgi:rhodanese-related sulfurtransferase